MMPGMRGLEQPGPVETIHLYPEERSALLGVLADLNDAEWERPTVCPGWSVRDIALHLLADDLGVLSRQRDEHRSLAPRPDESLGVFLARINDEWIQATRRLSGRVIMDLLGWSGDETYGHFSGVDPLALGGAVSWAGPGPAPRWLDIAREYTERWVHQQHIRDAVGRPGLKERHWFGPVLETFVLGLPRALGDAVPDGATLRLRISGDAGGEWRARRQDGAWSLGALVEGAPDATVQLDQEIAWRLFTKGITKEAARRTARIEGNLALADRAFDTVSILA